MSENLNAQINGTDKAEIAGIDVPKVEMKLKYSLQAERMLNEATEIATQHYDFGLMNSIIRNIAVSRARMGQFDIALTTVPLITTNRVKATTYAEIASIQGELGQDPNQTLEIALKCAKSVRAGPGGSKSKMLADKARAFSRIAYVQIDLGLLDDALKTAELIDESRQADKQDVLSRIGRKKITPDGIQKSSSVKTSKLKELDLDTEYKNASELKDPYKRSQAFLEIAGKQIRAGIDSNDTLTKVSKDARLIRIPYRRDEIFSMLAITQAEAGQLDNAIMTAEHLEYSYEKAMALTLIAPILVRNGFTSNEIEKLSSEIINTIASRSNNHTALEALGYFDKINEGQLPGLPSHVRTSVLIGLSEKSKDQDFLSEARRIAIEDEDSFSTKAFVEGVVDSQNYEAASNHLLGMLDQISPEVEPESARQTIRILRSLINIDNPKGKTIATKLFASERLPLRYRDYLAQKLFDDGYWDPELGKYLQSNEIFTNEDKLLRAIFGEEYEQGIKNTSGTQEFKPNRLEQRKILSAMIMDLGLTPDLASYQLIEKPGVLKSETLEERIVELKERVIGAEGKSRDELLEEFEQNPDFLKIFYVTKAGAYRYSVVNDYSMDKFKEITERIAELKVDDSTLNRFQEILEKGGLSSKEAQGIVEDAKAGRPFISGDERVIKFSSSVEYGSSYEVALQRLQEVWRIELKSLLLSRAAGKSPATLAESMEIIEDQEKNDQLTPKIYRLLGALKLDQDKISPQDIEAIAKDVRGRLMQTYSKDNGAKQRIREFSNTEAIYEYLKDNLPLSAASSEWFSHLQETLSDMVSAREKGGSKSADKQLELTFLDKNRDFVRAIRFADAAQCCFNASRQNFEHRTYEYVTRLNKDPLSFAMDLKQVGLNEIQGFIFGRLGVNPETGKLIVFLNGVYSQLKSDTMVDNILRIVEEQIGERLKPEAIMIASKFGGTIPKPKEYSVVKQQLEAIRALSTEAGLPETETYDDIGTVANGQFTFNGYAKTLNN